MKNKENWQPSKFIEKNGRLMASQDIKELSIASRLVTNLIGDCYSSALSYYATGKLLDLGCGKVPLYAAYKEFIMENICIDWGDSFHDNSHIDYKINLGAVLDND